MPTDKEIVRNEIRLEELGGFMFIIEHTPIDFYDGCITCDSLGWSGEVEDQYERNSLKFYEKRVRFAKKIIPLLPSDDARSGIRNEKEIVFFGVPVGDCGTGVGMSVKANSNGTTYIFTNCAPFAEFLARVNGNPVEKAQKIKWKGCTILYFPMY